MATGVRMSSEEIDEQRTRDLVYLYLCRLHEAKIWLEKVVKCVLPTSPFEIEEYFRSGVVLARLAQVITPELVPNSAIYDLEHARYECEGIMFRHTDNINLWLRCVQSCGLPRIFLPELADIYDKKNIPRLVHCLHALSVHMGRTHGTQPMPNLAGRMHVSDDVISQMQDQLKELRVAMPAFHDGTSPLPRPPPVETHMNFVEEDRLANCERVMKELQFGNDTSLFSVLQQCPEVSSDLNELVAPLYFSELNEHLINTGKVSVPDLISSVRFLNLVADVSLAVDSQSPQRVYSAVVALDTYCCGALEIPKDEAGRQGEIYLRFLTEARADHSLLTLEQIQDCLDLAHTSSDSVDPTEDHAPKSLKRRSSRISDVTPSKSSRPSFDSQQTSSVSDGEFSEQNPVESVRSPSLQQENCFEHTDSEEMVEPCVENVSPPVEELLEESFEAVNYALLAKNLEMCDEWEASPLNNKRLESRDASIDEPSERNSNVVDNFAKPREVIEERAPVQINKLDSTESCESSFFVACTAPFRINSQKNLQPNTKQADSQRNDVDKDDCAKSKDDESEKENIGTSSDHAIATLVQNVRREVVEAIKENDELALSVEDLDTRIGLLVRARESRETTAVAAATALPDKTSHASFKAFSQHARTLRQSYQKFLYMLQTRPEYLSRLLVNSGSTDRAVHRCVLNVYNMGAGHREACLMTRMLAHSLQLTIQGLAPTEMAAVLTQSAPVRLAVYLARQAPRNPLQTLLKPFVEQVLRETNAVETNPVDIYHRWLTQTEGEADGRPCGLSRGVNQKQALAHSHVQMVLAKNITILKGWVSELVTALVHNTHRLPYLVRYIGKCMRSALTDFLPPQQHKQIPKIICQVIYMAYLNCALVAPDAYHIVRKPTITRAQRTNLASIAKIVQLAASKNGFGGDSEHLASLNGFIRSCHDMMREMVSLWCEVTEPEIHYHHTSYADVTAICKPRLYITAQELCDCHALLHKQVDVVAPDSDDVFRQVLSALGSPLTPSALMGISPSNQLRDTDKMQAGRVLLYLEISGGGDESPIPARSSSVPRERLIKELDELKQTLKQLAEKKKYHEEQLDFYQKYLETCLQHVTNNNTSKKCGGSIQSVKYTARELEERGVLLKLDPVLTKQLNNVTFLLSTSPDQPGKFTLQCRFKRAHVDTATIDIQDLLRLQFEGEEQISILGKAHLSISHLVQLISKKLIK